METNKNTMRILESKTTENWLIFIIIVLFVSNFFIGAIVERRSQQEIVTDSTDSASKNIYETASFPLFNSTYTLAVADTPETRRLGLSGRATPPNNTDGMLFIFDEPGLHGIWMKDMVMNLDIFWLDENREIIYTEQNVSPETYPQVFTPEQDAFYVVELPTKIDNLP